MSVLHVYQNSVIDSFVARSPEHAAKLYREHWRNDLGNSPEDLTDYELVFELVPDEKPITIHCDDAPEGEPSKRTQTAAEWAAENGPGLLCSTEF